MPGRCDDGGRFPHDLDLPQAAPALCESVEDSPRALRSSIAEPPPDVELAPATRTSESLSRLCLSSWKATAPAGSAGAVVLRLPATMKLLGKRNWYLPKRLSWLPKFEHEPEVMPAAA